ncbi:O-antigen ligase family protein [Microbacterium sp. CCNWLW134]|uniref:O-antigen ligase family protein n=1 Tax=Microbacterium sp. CCNWLW134 TaxID=3122064 RepID=UPI00300F8C5A
MTVIVFVVAVVPTKFLPALAFSLFALGITQFVPSGLPLGVSSAIMVVWFIKRVLAVARPSVSVARRYGSTFAISGTRTLVPALAALLILWIFLLIEIGFLGASSVGWILSFIPVVVLPLLVADLSEEARVLERAWTVLGAVLGSYAVLEFVMGANVLYWALGAESSQHWSVYRAEGPLGHPLLLGTFLAVATVLAFGQWLEGRHSQSLVLAGLAMMGVLATSSRGSLLAVVAGTTVAIVAVILKPGRSRRGRAFGLVAMIAVGAAVVLPLSPLFDRWVSDEAGDSTAARTQIVELALSLAARSGYLGSGAGTSSIAARDAGSTLPIEASPLQMLVSIGVPGLLLVGAIVIIALTRSFMGFCVAAAAGLGAFMVAISGYNFFDDRRSALILLGAILIIALGRAASLRADSLAEDRGRSAA